MDRQTLRRHAAAILGYAAASLVFAWPLPLHFTTRLPGHPGGDTGVYIWNLWVFRFEALQGRLPLFTGAIFSLDRATDLSLHNYTIFANLVAFPFVPWLGVVGTYNLLVLLFFVLNGWAMFLLVRHLTSHNVVAWLAGLLFAFSPTLVARSTAHASLVAAAPIPLFLYCLLLWDERKRARWAVSCGASMAWAALCDPYYGIYCLMLAGWHVGSRVVGLQRGAWKPWPSGVAPRLLEGTVILLALVVGSIHMTGGTTVAVGAVRIGLQTAYTPMLLLTAALGVRLLMSAGLHIERRPLAEAAHIFRLAPVAILTTAILLAPLLVALAQRAADGRFVAPKVLWRTSTPGVDLLSLVAPNPNNAWLGAWSRPWLASRPGGFEENVASLTILALAVVIAASLVARFRPPPYWAGMAVISAWMTLGPFVQVAGVNTCIPTPWTFLRYLPPFSAARAPARLAVVAMLGFAVVFGLALEALISRWPRRASVTLTATALLLVCELFPAPRPLHSGRVSPIYDLVAGDPRDVRVLELPFGVRDGLSSYGNFSAASQFYQTRHQKRLIGGYLSRVSERRLAAIRRRPVLDALMTLSEGKPLPENRAAELAPIGRRFTAMARLGYVVVDRSRASESLTAFAIEVLDLEHLATDGERSLYRPRLQPTPKETVPGTQRVRAAILP